jgi:hypothetical protein
VGNWTLGGAGPTGVAAVSESIAVSPVNPALITFVDLSVPEPNTMVLAFVAAAGLSIAAIRKRRTR